MPKLFKSATLCGTVIFSLMLATHAIATDAPETRTLQNQIATSSKEFAGLLAQATQEINTPSHRGKVSELSDVKPTDSTAQSMPSPTERYGCISGYENRTFRGEQPVSRYEFAAALNACLNQVNQLINSNTADRATQEDLAVPKRQLESLRLELERLQMQLDGLDTQNTKPQ
jgi:flagellar hook-basal body complex protein FliE